MKDVFTTGYYYGLQRTVTLQDKLDAEKLYAEYLAGHPSRSLLPPGDYKIACPGHKPCNECGGAGVFTVSITQTGGSFGQSYDHKPECPVLRCPHGVPWVEDCATCDAEKEVADRGLRKVGV